MAVSAVRAELSAEDKVAAVQSLKSGGAVAMIAEGVNDAPVPRRSRTSASMGPGGSDAALEQADVVLINDRLESVVTADALSRRARRIIRENIASASAPLSSWARPPSRAAFPSPSASSLTKAARCSWSWTACDCYLRTPKAGP